MWTYALAIAVSTGPVPDPGPATIRVEGAGASLEVSPCPAGARCQGADVRVPPGEYVVTLRRPGNRPVRSSVTVRAGDALVHGAEVPLPSRTAELAWASTSLAVGAALVVSTVIVLALDGADGRDLRVAAPVAAGIGSALTLGGAWGIRWLDGEPERAVELPLELVPAP